jgi:hypothetical protein
MGFRLLTTVSTGRTKREGPWWRLQQQQTSQGVDPRHVQPGSVGPDEVLPLTVLEDLRKRCQSGNLWSR